LRKLILLFLTFVLLIFTGCGANLYHKGESAFEKKDYAEAVRLLEDAVAQEPGKSVIWRQLGIAYYRSDQFANAVDALKQATLLDPDDGVSILYLGLSQEILGNDTEAIEVYRTYLSYQSDADLSPRIRQRVRYLSDRKLQAEVRAIIENEDQIEAASIPENTIGVLGFDATTVDPQYSALGRGLSEMLTTDLAKVQSLKVVERLRLNEIRKELEFSESDIADKEHAPRLGKLIGAATVVSGEIKQPEPSELEAEAGLINTSKGIAMYPEGVGGKLEQFFAMEKSLLYNILDEMGYTPTEDEKLRLDSLPTSSFLAFLSYSRGMIYGDQGMYRLAEAEYNAALAEDPQFQAAASAKENVTGLDDYTGEVEPARDIEPDIFGLGQETTHSPEAGNALRVAHGMLGFQADESIPEEGDNPFVPPAIIGKVTVTGSFDPE